MWFYYLFPIIITSLIYGEQIIYQADVYTGTGDNLSSLYNAYIYAKKYNLKLEYGDFAHSEQFECSNILKPYRGSGNLVVVRTEQDIINNLSNPNAHFNINVLTDRPVPDYKTAQEAKQLLMPNHNLSLDYLPSPDKDRLMIVVHVRKGNNPENYHGEQQALQLYDYDRSWINYIQVTSDNPFALYRNQPTRDVLDKFWPLKYPPEQFYIDQLQRVINMHNNEKITVMIITDDRDPASLVERFKSRITGQNVLITRYDNTQKPFKTRIIEDLWLMAQSSIFIHAKSSFAFVAEVMGNHSVVITPEKARWVGNKLIIIEVGVRTRSN